MSSIYGKNIKISIFGESHGKAVGVTIDSLPSGVVLDMDKINALMLRRAPGQTPWSTPRKEADKVEILSGLKDNITTGAPLTGIIFSTNTKSGDYSRHRNIPRPSHADYTGQVRYDGHNIIAGGGHFSGRLTAPLVFAGAIAQQILEQKGVQISARIKQVRNIQDNDIDMCTGFCDSDIPDMKFPAISQDTKDKMIDTVLTAKKEGNSVGGIVECCIKNIPAGIGSPMFRSMESNIASMMFSVPAVKGVEFGAGFDIAKMHGSQANDNMQYENDKIITTTNNNGGLLGGITNSMPVIFRCAIKPTPSISLEQDTIDMQNKQNTKIKIEGRHDPCIIPRAVPVVIAAAAISILDTWMDQGFTI